MQAAAVPSPAGAVAVGAQDTFTRLWYGFMSARVVVASGVFLLVVGFSIFGTPGSAIALEGKWLIAICLAYLVSTVAARLLLRPTTSGDPFDMQRVPTIGVDMLMFAVLQYVQVGGLNYAPLFALPVLLASVLGSKLLAHGTAAAVTLVLLTDGWVLSLHTPADAAPRMLQAALTGLGYFAVSVLANQLAARLAREEEATRQSQYAARVQAQLNELVIATLADGVLIVDGEGAVTAANPSARALLGLPAEAAVEGVSLHSRPAWLPLAELAQRSLALSEDQTVELALPDPAGTERRVQVRTRLSGPHGGTGSLCVMFIQDLRELEARLRTEKLAAMGRMSAAVAHEIRNPLAAITQANALLEEDLRDATQRRLTGLVGQNAARLARIVEEVLDLARVPHHGLPAGGPGLELDPVVQGICGEWSTQARCGDRLLLTLAAPGVRVRFDPDHLRRIMVNLLDNALRHVGAAPGSIQVSTAMADGSAVLSVWSEGPPLEAGVRRHLFEPFFSSEARSSGLGLFISRELCERHGASIGHQRRPAGAGDALREGNDFFVRFGTLGTPSVPPAAFDTIEA